MQSVDDFRAGLNEQELAMIDALRSLVADASGDLVERIKWNAPSFAIQDEDRITLGLERKGGVRLVLHRGAKPKDAQDLAAVDVDRLAKWPAPDRGVITFKNVGEIEAKREVLSRLCRRWIEATS